MTTNVGLDIGYGVSKGVALMGGKIKQRSFPSAIDKVVSGMDEVHATYKDITGRYLVGEDAIYYGSPEQNSVDSSYISTQKYRVMGLYVLDQLMPESIKQDRNSQFRVNLVTGLPMEFYKKTRANWSALCGAGPTTKSSSIQ